MVALGGGCTEGVFSPELRRDFVGGGGCTGEGVSLELRREFVGDGLDSRRPTVVKPLDTFEDKKFMMSAEI